MIWRVFDPNDPADPAPFERPSPDRRSTLTDLFAWAVASRLVSDTKRNVDSLGTSVAYWEQLVGGTLGDLDRPAFDRFVGELQKLPGRHGERLANNTVRKHLRTIMVLVHLAVEERLIDAPRPSRRVPREEEPIVECLTPEEVGKLLAATGAATLPALPGFPAELWWVGVLSYIYWTGARIEATLGIRWGDIDMGNHLIASPTPNQKEKRRKMHPIALALRPVLDAMHAARERWPALLHPPLQSLPAAQRAAALRARDLVFPWATAPYGDARRGTFRFLSNAEIYRQLERIVTRAGIRPRRRGRWGFHDLRRTHGTLVADAGGEALAAQSLGHRVEVFRKSYDGHRMDRVGAAIERLPVPLCRIPAVPSAPSPPPATLQERGNIDVGADGQGGGADPSADPGPGPVPARHDHVPPTGGTGRVFDWN